MTDKELRKLNRLELLEMMIRQREELEQLRTQLEEANKTIEKQEEELQKLSSIADTALKLSGILETAREAADAYVERIMNEHMQQSQTPEPEQEAKIEEVKIEEPEPEESKPEGPDSEESKPEGPGSEESKPEGPGSEESKPEESKPEGPEPDEPKNEELMPEGSKREPEERTAKEPKAFEHAKKTDEKPAVPVRKNSTVKVSTRKVLIQKGKVSPEDVLKQGRVFYKNFQKQSEKLQKKLMNRNR